jgi:hypothetical protein
MIVVLLKFCAAVQQIVMVFSMFQIIEIFEVLVLKESATGTIFSFLAEECNCTFFGD